LTQVKEMGGRRAVRWLGTRRTRASPRFSFHFDADRTAGIVMAKKFPLHPKHPERICWGCDRYCSTDSMACGNGSGRTMHPAETLGEDWYTVGDWGFDEEETPAQKTVAMLQPSS